MLWTSARRTSLRFRNIKTRKRVSGFIEVEIIESDEVISKWKPGEKIIVYQFNIDHVPRLPKEFICLAKSEFCRIEAMKHKNKPIYGIQKHIETYTKKYTGGKQILKNFVNLA